MDWEDFYGDFYGYGDDPDGLVLVSDPYFASLEQGEDPIDPGLCFDDAA